MGIGYAYPSNIDRKLFFRAVCGYACLAAYWIIFAAGLFFAHIPFFNSGIYKTTASRNTYVKRQRAKMVLQQEEINTIDK